MANYPTYDPANYQTASDPSVFQNAAVSNAIEPGSTMKVLTTASALDQGVVQPDSNFYDPAHWVVDGFNITDIEEDGGARQQTISSILSLSLNTGATWMLMQMSQPGGTTITQKGVDAWHDYLVNHYRFGQYTNIEQGYESAGVVPTDDPTAPARALKFANTTFGQGIQLTALQMAAAVSGVVNGGTYYQPTLIDQIVYADGSTTTNSPKILIHNVVKPSVSAEMLPLMENVVTTYAGEGFDYMHFPSDYIVGGKTGTAQIASPAGGYYADKFNGTYTGFVGGDKPQYVIVVYNIEPNVVGYAGSHGGQPVFADLAHMLINDSFVTPKSH
jgi:cell division protein FtsI/penicillin-binding protein 2